MKVLLNNNILFGTQETQFVMFRNFNNKETKTSEYDQEMPQSKITDQPMHHEDKASNHIDKDTRT